MFTYHYDTFIHTYWLYRDKVFVAAFQNESLLLEFFPKAVKI